jgi:hypothetical protein
MTSSCSEGPNQTFQTDAGAKRFENSQGQSGPARLNSALSSLSIRNPRLLDMAPDIDL